MTVAVNGSKNDSIQSELIKVFFSFLSLMPFLGKQFRFRIFFSHKPFAFGIIPYRTPQPHKWYENKKYKSNCAMRALVATNKPTPARNDDIAGNCCNEKRNKMDVTHAKHYSSLSLRTASLKSFCLACEREVCGKTNGDPLHKDIADSERLAQCVNLNSCHSPLQNLRGTQMHVQRSVDRSVVSKTHFCTICISKAASDSDQLKLDVVKNFAVL